MRGAIAAARTKGIIVLLVTGRILEIIQDSEAVVQAGTALMEIGDPADLEVVADLLSTDAVQIKVDAPVRIDGWGGAPLQGRVVRIDPAGFVKVSALGIEEQRVRTIVEFTDNSLNVVILDSEAKYRQTRNRHGDEVVPRRVH